MTAPAGWPARTAEPARQGERQDVASQRVSLEAERRKPERAAGLLGERWMRELSNGPSAAR